MVLVTAPYMTMDLEYYYGNADVDFVGYGTPRGAAVGDTVQQGRSTDEARLVLPSQGWELEVDKLVSGRSRVWLFQSRIFHGDLEGRVQGYFGKIARKDLEFSAAGVELMRYDVRGIREERRGKR